VLSPLLYSLFTHDSNTIIKFAEGTTVLCLITDDDETAYREEVRDLAVWCQDNNLSLNVSKTRELNVDNRKRRAEHDLSTSLGPSFLSYRTYSNRQKRNAHKRP
jgi:hypothetical protein